MLRGELESRELATPAFFGGTTLLAVPLFVLTAAMFFAFPARGLWVPVEPRRACPVGRRLWGRRRARWLRHDPRRPHGGDAGQTQEPAQPAARSIAIRLRGTSFDRYSEGRWSRTQSAGTDLRRLQDEYIVFRPPKPEDQEYEIILDPMEEAVLFLPEGTVALQVPPTVRAGRDRYRRIVHSPGLDLRYGGQREAPLTYNALVAPKLRGFSGAIPRALRKRYIEVPEGYERVSALAREVVRGVSEPARAGPARRAIPPRRRRLPLHARAARHRRQGSAARLLVRSQGGALRVLLDGDGHHDAVARYARAQRHRLSRCGLQPIRRLLRRSKRERPQLGGGAHRRAVGDLRPDACVRPGLRVAVGLLREATADDGRDARPLGGVRRRVQHPRSGQGLQGLAAWYRSLRGDRRGAQSNRARLRARRRTSGRSRSGRTGAGSSRS